VGGPGIKPKKEINMKLHQINAVEERTRHCERITEGGGPLE
jgi:hypothetical protein